MTTVLLDVEGPLARITLNRPDRLNAIDEALAHDLDRAVRDARRGIRPKPDAEPVPEAVACGDCRLRDHSARYTDHAGAARQGTTGTLEIV